MKKRPVLRFALALACVWCGASARLHAAGSYSEAEFTRLENDVKVLKDNTPPAQAVVGQQIKAVTSIATGVNSRAELRFPDKSLTRLGSNSRFTVRGDARTLDLNQGVMMLEVPKRIGGAKVRTAAVTAAVTGTTVMFEYLPNGYVKLIVIEGSVDLSENANPSVFRTINAGQMLIMNPNAKVIPLPVDVDLKRLLKTSKLWNFNDSNGNNDHPNYNHVQQSVQNQQQQLGNGQLVETNLFIPGRGTTVNLLTNIALNVLNLTVTPVVPPATAPGAGPGTGPGATTTSTLLTQNTIGAELAATVLNSGTTIYMDPQITAWNSVTKGSLTTAGQIETPNIPAIAGVPPGSVAQLEPLLNLQGNWAAFGFNQLLINGNPVIAQLAPGASSSGVTPITNLLLEANNGITLGQDFTFYNPSVSGTAGSVPTGNELDLTTDTSLKNLMLYANKGNLQLEANFTLNGGIVGGNSQNVGLYAVGLGSDVNLAGKITLRNNSNLIVSAANDLNLTGTVNLSDTSSVYASVGNDVNITYSALTAYNAVITSGHDINVTGAPVTIGENLQFTANNSINITANSQLSVSSTDLQAGLQLTATQGSVTISNSVLESGNSLVVQSISQDVALTSSSLGAVNISLSAGRDIAVSGSTLTANPSPYIIPAAKHPGTSSTTTSATLSLSAVRNINITNSSTLQVLANNPNALLQILAQQGNIVVDSSTLTAGTGGGAGSTLDVEANLGNISITNSVLSGDIIKARTLGPNGTLTIGNTTFNATTLLRLYAEGSNGLVNFTGNTILHGPTVQIAAPTVTVNNGVTVTVDGAPSIYTNNAKYNNGGVNGNFSTMPNTSAFSGRPTY